MEQAQVAETMPAETADDFDKERALSTIRKLREFEKSAKSQLKELEEIRAERRKADEARLSDSEKLSKRVRDLEAEATAAKEQLTRERRERWAMKLATDAGAHDPLDANIVQALDSLDPNSSDAESEMRKAIEGLKKSKPWLFKGATQRLEPMNPSAGGGEAMTDQQRVKNLMGAMGINSYGPLGR